MALKTIAHALGSVQNGDMNVVAHGICQIVNSGGAPFSFILAKAPPPFLKTSS